MEICGIESARRGEIRFGILAIPTRVLVLFTLCQLSTMLRAWRTMLEASEQGSRQAEIYLSETVVVIGAGLVGVLTVLLAGAAGCRVVAIDLDRARMERAIECGTEAGFVASEPGVEGSVHVFSRYGADAAVITGATRSAEPPGLATKLLRDRGRIKAVGDAGLGMLCAAPYDKQLSLAHGRTAPAATTRPTKTRCGPSHRLLSPDGAEKLRSILAALPDGTRYNCENLVATIGSLMDLLPTCLTWPMATM